MNPISPLEKGQPVKPSHTRGAEGMNDFLGSQGHPDRQRAASPMNIDAKQFSLRSATQT